MQICRIDMRQLDKALELVWRVFEECDAEDYEEIGIQTFRHFIRWENMKELLSRGEMVFFGAFDGGRLIGVIAMRSGFHISLLFVERQYQRKGVAKRLVRRGAAYCLEQNPELRRITVNSSPKGRKAYEAMGFYKLAPEQVRDGMRYTPMRIDV